MKPVFLITVMIAVFVPGAGAQSSPTCDSVVTKVSLENTAGLTSERQASLKRLLIGRCFQREHGDVLGEAVYKQLRRWGYKQPTVYDPASILILNGGVHPSPVAVAIDFHLTGSDQLTK